MKALTGDEDGVTVAARLNLIVGRLMRTIRQHAAAGLTPSQLSALVTVDERGPLRISALATQESLGAPAATRVVASLEEAGLVTRSSDPDDKRASLIALTKVGGETLKTLRKERATGLGAQLDALSESERRLLERALPVLEKISHDCSQ
ncbi:MAG: MarR family winged helix-turn-helix transcriptional regulator [Acidimicrobiales bacterium]